jgi:hypothetical protein
MRSKSVVCLGAVVGNLPASGDRASVVAEGRRVATPSTRMRPSPAGRYGYQEMFACRRSRHIVRAAGSAWRLIVRVRESAPPRELYEGLRAPATNWSASCRADDSYARRTVGGAPRRSSSTPDRAQRSVSWAIAARSGFRCSPWLGVLALARRRAVPVARSPRSSPALRQPR